MALPPRVQTLIRLLASDNDGEALNAVRALGRALRSEGMDFHTLADGIPTANQSRHHRPAPEPPPRPKRKAKKEAGSHADDLAWLRTQPYAFTQREREFMDNLSAWEGELTEKQSAWFQTILAKARQAAECGF